MISCVDLNISGLAARLTLLFQKMFLKGALLSLSAAVRHSAAIVRVRPFDPAPRAARPAPFRTVHLPFSNFFPIVPISLSIPGRTARPGRIPVSVACPPARVPAFNDLTQTQASAGRRIQICRP